MHQHENVRVHCQRLITIQQLPEWEKGLKMLEEELMSCHVVHMSSRARRGRGARKPLLNVENNL
jgi:hypothetical protein